MKPNYAHNTIAGLRFIPVGAFLLMFLHVTLLQFNIDYPISEIGVILCGFYITHRFSITFDFCLLHRILIYYALLIMSCIWLRRWTEGEFGVFGQYIYIVRDILFYIGLALFLLLCHRHVRMWHKKKRLGK